MNEEGAGARGLVMKGTSAWGNVEESLRNVEEERIGKCGGEEKFRGGCSGVLSRRVQLRCRESVQT